MDKAFDIVVLGGGICGLSAGLTAARLGRSTLILTGHALGGHLLSIEKIEGFPGYPDGVAGYELGPMTQQQAADAGAEFAMAEASGIDETANGWSIAAPSGSYGAKAVIVATGTRLRELGVPGEAILRGKGVSHCASCDAPLLGGRKVVVTGGGDSAMQEALTLAEHASEVTIVHRGEAPEGQASFLDRVRTHPRIVLRPDSEVVEILGDEAVTGARVRNNTGGQTEDLETAAVFVYIGLEPNAGFLGERAGADASGRLLTDAGFRAGPRGLFAAGTVRAGSAGRAVAAAGEGSAAAIAADRFLADGDWPG